VNGEQDVYSQRSYGSEAIGFGSKPGVAVVDFQLGFTDPVFSLVVRPWFSGRSRILLAYSKLPGPAVCP